MATKRGRVPRLPKNVPSQQPSLATDQGQGDEPAPSIEAALALARQYWETPILCNDIKASKLIIIHSTLIPDALEKAARNPDTNAVAVKIDVARTFFTPPRVVWRIRSLQPDG